MTRIPLSCLALALLASQLLTAPARAAESYDNCASTVATLPAVIGTQGVWCLKKDLATNLASGAAITVSAPNVTIDCNGFKLGGLSAGTGTATIGIQASGTSNLTVRGCNIRGFAIGVDIDDTSGGGHLVEDNRFDGNTQFAIRLFGDGSMIRDNQVLDTGGGTGVAVARIAGIEGEGSIDILGNTVRGIDGTSQPSAYAYGIILLAAQGATIGGNRVGGVIADPGKGDFGLRLANTQGVILRDNDIGSNLGDYGIYCSGVDENVAVGNMIQGFNAALSTCQDGGGNFVF